MNPQHDEALRDALLRDSGTGWDPFWRTYQPLIWSIINWFKFSREDSEDILQDISEHLCANTFDVLRRWDARRSPLAAFLGAVVRNKCRDFMRSSFYKYTLKKVEVAKGEENSLDPLDLLESEGEGPDRYLQRIQVMETLHVILSEMADMNQISHHDWVMVAMLAAGADYNQIAVILGISRDNAMTRFSRIKPKLRAHLERKGIKPADAGE